MTCIFCKQNSDSSKSVEHIVPESLGNKKHVLPKGVVCDRCNNYFAVKIEKQVLETDFFKNFRFRNELESKKGRVPPGTVIFPRTNSSGEISFDDKGIKAGIDVHVNEETFNLIMSGEIKQMHLPMNFEYPADNQAVSKMLGKIALEMFASRFIENNVSLAYLIEEEQFDPLRNYVRFNPKNETWIYQVRRIYKEDEKFFTADGNLTDMVFECDFLATEWSELYFVIAFKGVEFTLNMAGSSIEGYDKWLAQNNDISPLYRRGADFGYKLTPDFLRNKMNNSI
jgi:transcription elongation factor Elf1